MQKIPESDRKFCWWRDGVIYQIYTRSFMDTNGDGIGDLKGVISKLDYLADLGVTGIWLTPIHPSPNKDFGYDVSDYRAVNPEYGTMEDYQTLLEEAHARKLHVIMDMVLNHSSDQHPWFIESARSKDNPFHDYYIWRDPVNGHAPTNWLSCFSGPAWEYVPACGQYYYHMFTKEQPDWNWRNPKVHQYLMDNFRFWAEKGVDGFRLDVFNMYFKDDQFRNDPPFWNRHQYILQKHIHDCDQPEMKQTVQEIRKIVDSCPDHYVVGEPLLGNPQKAASYCVNYGLNSAFNFKFARTPWDASRFREKITAWDDALKNGNGCWPNYVLNNHDLNRSASRYGLGEYDGRLKCAAAMTLLLRGTPFLYYGEEIGMRDLPLKKETLIDPVGKAYWPWNKGRDGCRSPMQWNNMKNAGFTTGTPWLPVNQDYEKRNVNSMIHDPDSLFSFYKKVIALRRSSPALQHGDLQMLDPKNETVLAFARTCPTEGALVCINFSQLPSSVDLSGLTLSPKWHVRFSSLNGREPEIKNRKLSLKGEEVVVFIN